MAIEQQPQLESDLRRSFRTLTTQISTYQRRNEEWITRIGSFGPDDTNSNGERLLRFDTPELLVQRITELAGEAYKSRRNLITLVEQLSQASSPIVPPTLSGAVSQLPYSIITGTSRKVEFKVTPDVTESKSVSYIPITDIRSAGSIHIFIGSPGRTFGINAKFVSRTQEEAKENFQMLHLLKGWTVPEKGYDARGGNGSTIDSDTPRIVNLYGYGQQLKGIPTVLTSLGVTYPSDVDYITFSDNTSNSNNNTSETTRSFSIPIIMNVDIQLQEVRSADELTGDTSKSPTAFDIKKYKNGELPGW